MAENEIVEVEISRDNAVLLLDAAQRAGLHPSVVETTSEGVFRVPSDVASDAGLGRKGTDKPSESKVKKAAEAVVESDPEPFGDPHEQPERSAPSNTITTAQADAEINALNSEAKGGEKRAPAKKAAAKKSAPAKKAAATQQKSE